MCQIFLIVLLSPPTRKHPLVMKKMSWYPLSPLLLRRRYSFEGEEQGPTSQRVGWTVTGPSLAERLHSLGFCLVSSRETHTPRRRGHLRVAISTVSDPSGSGRVDMLTGPVAAAQAAVATGAWVKSKHMYPIRGSVGA